MPIERIRIANQTFIERDHYKDINENLKAVILTKNAIIREKEQLFDIQVDETKTCKSKLDEAAKQIIDTEKKAYKFKKQRNVLGITSVVFLVLILL